MLTLRSYFTPWKLKKYIYTFFLCKHVMKKTRLKWRNKNLCTILTGKMFCLTLFLTNIFNAFFLFQILVFLQPKICLITQQYVRYEDKMKGLPLDFSELCSTIHLSHMELIITWTPTVVWLSIPWTFDNLLRQGLRLGHK